MELREWLIILGLALVTIIVIDGVRRLQRQRRVPRLDRVDASSPDAMSGTDTDPEQEARDAEVRSELPNGGARVVRPAAYGEPRPKPKLERQEHPGPSRVLSSWRQEHPRDGEPVASRQQEAAPRQAREPSASGADVSAPSAEPRHDKPHDDALRAVADAAGEAPTAARQAAPVHQDNTREDAEARGDREDEVFSGLAADPADHEGYQDDERYRLVDFDEMSDSLRTRSARVGDSMHRFGSSIQQKMASRKEQRKKDKLERERQKAERQAREASRRQQAQAEREAEARRAADVAAQGAQGDSDDPLFAPRASAEATTRGPEPGPNEPRLNESQREAWDLSEAPGHERQADEMGDPWGDGAAPHPTIQRALRNGVRVEHPRETLSHAEEIIVISVMSRDEDGFSGAALLELMLACGLRYCRDMQIFHRFETEDPESALQFSMVNIVKPGTFPLAAGEDFATPGISLLMPLPGAHDSSAAFEAMVETAMVVVRHLGGELKDENQSVMTAQTVGFARERVQEFERRHRLHRTQVN
ncbi:cell division protein ZipA [Halomonas sp. YLGW01]|uniref:cell division protein ZipA n=1 Tax=Halomonas sp. YLGW01 TaxID=2773308 RepID=UPI0017876FCB|nr:cell division protein ZipA [Halomonas sp. YLGW01]